MGDGDLIVTSTRGHTPQNPAGERYGVGAVDKHGEAFISVLNADGAAA
jgi:hypothetical protein